MSDDIKNVVVLGASADQGVPLISALLEADITPIAAARRLDAMKTTPFPDTETVFADLNDQGSLEKAFAGQDALAMHCPLNITGKRPRALAKISRVPLRLRGLKKLSLTQAAMWQIMI